MSNVTLKGNPVTLNGTFPSVGQTAPDFTLVAKDLKDVGLKDFAGKRKVLNIVPAWILRYAPRPHANSTKRPASWTTRWCW